MEKYFKNFHNSSHFTLRFFFFKAIANLYAGKLSRCFSEDFFFPVTSQNSETQNEVNKNRVEKLNVWTLIQEIGSRAEEIVEIFPKANAKKISYSEFTHLPANPQRSAAFFYKSGNMQIREWIKVNFEFMSSNLWEGVPWSPFDHLDAMNILLI